MIKGLINGLGGFLLSNSLDREDNRVQAAIWFLIIVSLAVVIGLMACGITGTVVFASGWFWAGAFGVAAIATIDWLRNKDHTATIYRVAIGILVVGILMLILRVAHPDASIKSAAEALRARHASTSSAIQATNEKIYTPGEYTFSLRAGEITPFWITFPPGKISQWDLTSGDNKFQVVYPDGEVVSAWSAGYLPSNKYAFKIAAVTDQHEIKMIVR